MSFVEETAQAQAPKQEVYAIDEAAFAATSGLKYFAYFFVNSNLS